MLTSLRIAVIIDDDRIQRFARLALDSVEGADEVSVFSCTSTQPSNRTLKHALYYVLNLSSVRNQLTRFVPLHEGRKRVASWLEFESEYDGQWQVLPAHAIEALSSGGYDVILKFGMGLLRVPSPEQLAVPILSYHHGDPDRYRGRPAGFWEIVEGANVMGQIVQVISNRLDAGQVVASAETRVLPWSWRGTLIESFRHSPLLINRAIRNARTGDYLKKPCTGRNYRLPGNWTVLLFIVRMGWRFLRRVAYAAAVEKTWRVSTASVEGEPISQLLNQGLPQRATWHTLPVRRRNSFYADPFFVEGSSDLLVEALNKRSGLGEIVLIAGDEHRSVWAGRRHMSYPSTVALGGRTYVLPETASWSGPTLYRIEDKGLEPAFDLRIEGQPRIVDPTLLVRSNGLFLFGNMAHVGSNVLYLWYAASASAEFRMHPRSPIRISPAGSRMGGALVELDGRLIRLGQDFTRGYGDGLIIFSVEGLTSRQYSERPIGHLRCADRKGPHTLNLHANKVVFDWYRERFTPLAGLRRLAARLHARGGQSNLPAKARERC